MVVFVLAGALVTFVVLRIGARWDVDRQLGFGLAVVGIAAVVGTRLAGDDDFTAGYWAIGFAFGAPLHYFLSSRRGPSAH